MAEEASTVPALLMVMSSKTSISLLPLSSISAAEVVTVITEVEVTFLILLNVIPFAVTTFAVETLLTSTASTEVIFSNGFNKIPDVAFRVVISP